MKTLKTHALAFALGVVVACLAVWFLTLNDRAVKKVKQQTATIAEQHEALSEDRKQADTLFKKELANIQRDTAVQIKQAKSETQKLIAENAGLKKENSLLHIRIDELNIQLNEREKLQAESLAALNASTRALQAKTAREQAMKIGVGVGVPLAIVGSFVGGFYLAGAVR